MSNRIKQDEIQKENDNRQKSSGIRKLSTRRIDFNKL